MEDTIQKHIIDYFSFFEEFYNASKKNLKDCQKCAISINKLINRCKNIKQAELINTPLEKYTGIQNRLCAKLYDIVSEKSQEIRNSLSLLEELFEKLCTKHRALQEVCRNIDLNENTALVKGTPLQPPLKKLLLFSDETLNFASQICAQFDTALSVLAFKKLDTASLPDCFKIPQDWQQQIPEIVAYTSFVSENQI